MIREFAKKENLDLAPQELTARWIAATGYQPDRPNWFKRLISRIRLYLRQRGWLVHHLTDDDIASVLYRAARAGRRTDGVRMSTDGNGEVRIRESAALRRFTDPNTAGQKGQLRDGKVPTAKGFMQWAGLPAENLYADYEFLYSRHSKYFASQEETRAAVELVLAKPEQVKDLNGNASFAGFDEATGDIYRLEINKRITGRANHIRSVFKITPEQYSKIKLAEPRVLQPSSTALPEGGRKTMTIASFMHNITQNDGKSTRQSLNPEMELRTRRLVDRHSDR